MVGRYKNEKQLIRHLERQLGIESDETIQPDEVKANLREREAADHAALVDKFRSVLPKREAPTSSPPVNSAPEMPKVEVMDSSRYANAVSVEEWRAIKAKHPPEARQPEEITPDIAGSLYVSLAEPSIDAARMAGLTYVGIDIEVPKNGTAFTEFKAIMRSRGYIVDVEEIYFKGKAFAYRVGIRW